MSEPFKTIVHPVGFKTGDRVMCKSDKRTGTIKGLVYPSDKDPNGDEFLNSYVVAWDIPEELDEKVFPTEYNLMLI